MSSVHSYPIFGNWKTTLQNWKTILSSLKLSSHVRDVYVPNRVNKDILMFNSLRRRWENKSLYEVLTETGQFIQDESITAGTEKAIGHDLGVEPSMVLIVKTVGGVIEHGSTANTSTTVYIKNKSSSQASTVSILVLP